MLLAYRLIIYLWMNYRNYTKGCHWLHSNCNSNSIRTPSTKHRARTQGAPLMMRLASNWVIKMPTQCLKIKKQEEINLLVHFQLKTTCRQRPLGHALELESPHQKIQYLSLSPSNIKCKLKHVLTYRLIWLYSFNHFSVLLLNNLNNLLVCSITLFCPR